MQLHMISYFPNGSIQSKVHICSCVSCIEGEFMSCLIEKGKIVQVVDEASDNDDNDDSSESEEWPSGLRRCNKNRKVPGSKQTRRLAGLRDPTSLRGSR